MGTQVSLEYIIRPPCMMQFYDALCLQGDQEGSVLIRGSESHKKSKCQHNRHFLQIRMVIVKMMIKIQKSLEEAKQENETQQKRKRKQNFATLTTPSVMEVSP